MKKIIYASSEMPSYLYMVLPSGEKDVFIYKFVSETETEEGKIYTYESNEFRTKKLTKQDIAVNPFKYLDYVEKEATREERFEAQLMFTALMTDSLLESEVDE